jgi:hypothetical protein
VGRSDRRSRLNWREPSVRSIAAQTLRIAVSFLAVWPDSIFGGLPKTTVHRQPPPSSSRVYWTARYSIDRPVWPQARSGPQILVALRSRAKTAVMAVMSTKSREVIYGGRIIGARIRAEGAREAAQKAVREADRAAAELWSIQMEAYGGPAQPSPTIAQCLYGGYGWLQVKCHRCETEASIPLEHVRRPRDTPIWKLEAALKCRSCRTPRYSPRVHMIKLTQLREIAPYKWVHPDDDERG